MKTLQKSIHFGIDGWRGIISDDFTFENVKKVAGASPSFFKIMYQIQKSLWAMIPYFCPNSLQKLFAKFEKMPVPKLF